MARLHPPADDNKRYWLSERVCAIKPILQSPVLATKRVKYGHDELPCAGYS